MFGVEEAFYTTHQVILSIIQNPIFVKYGLAGLFVNGVLSATILPIPTEITTTALLASGHTKLSIFIVLAISTTLGSFASYFLGRSGSKLFAFLIENPKKNEEDDDGAERNSRLLSKYGWIAILLSSWIPAIGDLMPIIAGTKKYDLQKFAFALVIGKVTKAIALVYLASFLSSIFF